MLKSRKLSFWGLHPLLLSLWASFTYWLLAFPKDGLLVVFLTTGSVHLLCNLMQTWLLSKKIIEMWWFLICNIPWIIHSTLLQSECFKWIVVAVLRVMCCTWDSCNIFIGPTIFISAHQIEFQKFMNKCWRIILLITGFLVSSQFQTQQIYCARDKEGIIIEGAKVYFWSGIFLVDISFVYAMDVLISGNFFDGQAFSGGELWYCLWETLVTSRNGLQK